MLNLFHHNRIIFVSCIINKIDMMQVIEIPLIEDKDQGAINNPTSISVL